MYFNYARNCIPLYAKTNDGVALKTIQYCYWEAVELNPLEFFHYANRLNGDYLKRITDISQARQ